MTPTQRKFWPDIGPACGDGETCARFLPTPSVHGNYNRKGASKTSGDGLATAVKNGTPISFAVASHAPPSLLQGNDAEMPTPDGSGPKCCEFARYSDQDGCWLKTSQGYCQRMLDGSSEEWLQIWPRSGYLCDGIAYRRQALVPRISAIGSSLLPTPDKNCAERGGTTKRGVRPSGAKRQVSLNDVAKAEDGGALNPQFVAWMMGFPLDWCDMPDELPEASPTESLSCDASATL